MVTTLNGDPSETPFIAGVCYFVQGTILTLAKGNSGELTAQAIRELLIAMQGTHHN